MSFSSSAGFAPALLLLSAACVVTSHDDGVATDETVDELRLDEVQAKASHNSFERDEPLFDQLVYHRVHALELDFHNGKGSAAPRGDFFVYHVNVPTMDRTSCTMLSDCLRQLRAYHDAFPEHELVTVFLDEKDGWDPAAGHGPSELDALLTSAFDPASIERPADLLAACPSAQTLRAAVGAGGSPTCHWPRLSALRGKFLFAITGGDACDPSANLNVYAGAAAAQRAAFIAPEVNDSCTIQRYASIPSAVLLNFAGGRAAQAREARSAGLLGRVYGANDAATFATARTAGASYIATDSVNVATAAWSTTATSTGWPFRRLGDGENPTLGEKQRLIGTTVRSGDLDGSADSFFLAARAGTTATWSAAISVESSHVERWAKGCLMARASADADAPYFAVCRPADVRPMRIQYRLTRGGSTTSVEAPAPDGFSVESTFFARLGVSAGAGSGVSVTGEVSADGKSWASLTQAFSTALPLQGIATSGHGSESPVKFLFGNLTANDGTGPRAVMAADLGQGTPVAATDTAIFDGPLK